MLDGTSDTEKDDDEDEDEEEAEDDDTWDRLRICANNWSSSCGVDERLAGGRDGTNELAEGGVALFLATLPCEFFEFLPVAVEFFESARGWPCICGEGVFFSTVCHVSSLPLLSCWPCASNFFVGSLGLVVRKSSLMDFHGDGCSLCLEMALRLNGRSMGLYPTLPLPPRRSFSPRLVLCDCDCDCDWVCDGG